MAFKRSNQKYQRPETTDVCRVLGLYLLILGFIDDFFIHEVASAESIISVLLIACLLFCQLAIWRGGEAEGWRAASSTWEQSGLVFGSREQQGERLVHVQPTAECAMHFG